MLLSCPVTLQFLLAHDVCLNLNLRLSPPHTNTHYNTVLFIVPFSGFLPNAAGRSRRDLGV